MTLSDAEKQQEAIKKIMADQKVPFEKAVDVYIEHQNKAAGRPTQT